MFREIEGGRRLGLIPSGLKLGGGLVGQNYFQGGAKNPAYLGLYYGCGL